MQSKVESDFLVSSLSLSLGLASFLVSCVLLILAMSVNLECELILTFIRFLGLAFSN
jgi:hypothetical protein